MDYILSHNCREFFKKEQFGNLSKTDGGSLLLNGKIP